MTGNKIRFTRLDYNKLCADEFYSTKNITKYFIFTELGDKKVAVWDSLANTLVYNSNKNIVDWLTSNSFIKNDLLESEDTQAYYKYIEPKAFSKIKKVANDIDKSIMLKSLSYTDGDTKCDFVFEMDINEDVHRDEMFGRTYIASKLNDFKWKLKDELNELDINIVNVNLNSYKIYKSPSKVLFSITALMSFTKTTN